MKRFYKVVAVEAAEGGHRILLDGRPVRTPADPAGRLRLSDGADGGGWPAP